MLRHKPRPPPAVRTFLVRNETHGSRGVRAGQLVRVRGEMYP